MMSSETKDGKNIQPVVEPQVDAEAELEMELQPEPESKPEMPRMEMQMEMLPPTVPKLFGMPRSRALILAALTTAVIGSGAAGSFWAIGNHASSAPASASPGAQPVATPQTPPPVAQAPASGEAALAEDRAVELAEGWTPLRVLGGVSYPSPTGFGNALRMTDGSVLRLPAWSTPIAMSPADANQVAKLGGLASAVSYAPLTDDGEAQVVIGEMSVPRGSAVLAVWTGNSWAPVATLDLDANGTTASALLATDAVSGTGIVSTNHWDGFDPGYNATVAWSKMVIPRLSRLHGPIAAAQADGTTADLVPVRRTEWKRDSTGAATSTWAYNASWHGQNATEVAELEAVPLSGRLSIIRFTDPGVIHAKDASAPSGWGQAR
jgi:hypothetical protein